MQPIPTVDIGRFLDGSTSRQELDAVAVACEDHGFFLLCGHGCDLLIEQTFAVSQRFFAQPKPAKMSVFRDADNPFGYYDRELTKQRRDLKEVFDFQAGGYQSSNPAKQPRWPDNMADFRATLTSFYSTFTDLSETTMRMIFVALGLPPTGIEKIMADGFGDAHTSTARLNYYPANDPVPRSEQQQVTPVGDMALHHHTDPGAITLLLQDDHGGLQALSKSQGWIDVPPQAGTIVVNVGDVLQVWTNDRCVAGVHRVLPVQSPAGRFSTPFFFQPRHDAMIEPWLDEGDTPRYHGFSWREFIRGRVSDNFADYGSEDIQIERYRIAV